MERQNVGRIKRRVRMVVGSLSPPLGIVLLIPGEASLHSGANPTMLVSAGLYLFVTGSTGYCPNHHRLGRSPWRTEGEDDSSSYRWRRSWHDGGVPLGREQWVLVILYRLIAVVAWLALGAREMRPEHTPLRGNWSATEEDAVLTPRSMSTGEPGFPGRRLRMRGLTAGHGMMPLPLRSPHA